MEQCLWKREGPRPLGDEGLQTAEGIGRYWERHLLAGIMVDLKTQELDVTLQLWERGNTNTHTHTLLSELTEPKDKGTVSGRSQSRAALGPPGGQPGNARVSL